MNGAAWRGITMLLLLSALAFAAQRGLVEHLLAPWRLVVEALEPDFRVVDLRAQTSGTEQQINLVVTPARVIVVGGRAVAPDASAQAQASTPRGAVWLLLSVYLATLVAWPVARPAREWPLRAALGLPLLLALLLLDVPITLLGPLRAVIVDTLSPGQQDLWTLASQFLRSGGRYLVAIAGATGVCLLSQATLSTRSRTS
jgi:hypothetical protein